MKDEGWIKLYRKVWKKPWMSNPNYSAVWHWILCSAEYQEEEDAEEVTWEGVTRKLQKGEFTFGTHKIAKETGVNRASVERAIQRFITEQQIEVKTSHKFSLGKVKNWSKYQPDRTTDRASGEQLSEQGGEHSTKKNKNIKNKEVNTIGETAEPLADAGDEEYKKQMNPEVTEVITFLMEKMSLSKLDKSVPINRRMAYLALKKFGLEQVKAIIEIASQDDYWRSRVTSVGDIYYNGLKIASTKRFASTKAVPFI